jgi:hypothetical protein
MERRGANTMIERRRATASFAAAEAVAEDAEQAIADAAEAQAAREEFAAWLRAGRDARGMTIAQVAQTTRIQQRALERLEAACFDELPADVFVRGFIRNYARCVGLPVDEALDRYGACGLTAGPVASVKAQALVSSMAPLAPDTARHHLPGGSGGARGTTAPPRATTAGPRLLTSPGLPALLADADAAAVTAAALSPRGGLAAGTDTRMPAIRDDQPPVPVVPPVVATAPIAASLAADGDDTSSARSRRKGGQRKRRGQQRRDRARTVTASMAVPTIEAALVAAAFAEPAVEAPAVEAPIASGSQASASQDPIPAVEAAPDTIAAETAAPVAVDPSMAMTVEVPATRATSELAAAIANLDPAASASLVAILEAALRVQNGQHGLHSQSQSLGLPSFDDDMPEIEILYSAPTADLGPVSTALASASAQRRRSTTIAVPSLVIDDDDPESAEREREARSDREPARRSFLPPILLDEPAARQGGLTLAVIILLIVATLTLSYLMRRPSSSGEGITSLPAAPTHVA